MIDAWPFVLVALAAWRVFHLLAFDTILDQPLAGIRARYSDLVECPFCLGFWIAVTWVAAYWLEPHWTLIAAVPWAVSAAVAFLQIAANALAD